MIVRRAEPKDIDAILRELERHVQACCNDYPAPERDVVTYTVLSAFHHTSPTVVFVAYDGDELTGIACAVSGPYLWAKETQAEIRLIYVTPERRGGFTFSRLLHAVEQWCDEKKARKVSFTLASGIGDEETALCLERRGWKRTGIDMVKVA